MRVDQWKVLAAFLLDDQDGSTTERIEKSNHFDVTACCAALIREYLKSGDVSWQHVLKSLRVANYKNLAIKIQKELDIKSMYKKHLQ